MTTEFLNEKFSQLDCAELNAEDPRHISWDNAVKWTKNFRDEFGDKQKFNDKKVKGYFMSRGSVEDLLAQDGLALQGIKIYIGYDENEVFRVIVVAVKGNKGYDYNVPDNADSLRTAANADLPSIGESRPCPEWCGKDNVLNHP